MANQIIQAYFDDSTIPAGDRQSTWDDLHSGKVDENTLSQSITQQSGNKYTANASVQGAMNSGQAPKAQDLVQTATNLALAGGQAENAQKAAIDPSSQEGRHNTMLYGNPQGTPVSGNPVGKILGKAGDLAAYQSIYGSGQPNVIQKIGQAVAGGLSQVGEGAGQMYKGFTEPMADQAQNQDIGKGFQKMIGGSLVTVSAPVGAVLSSVPGGETVGKALTPSTYTDFAIDHIGKSLGASPEDIKYWKDNVGTAANVAGLIVAPDAIPKAGELAGKGIDTVGKSIKSTAEFTAAQATGLNPEDFSFVNNNPKLYESAQKGEITRDSIGKQILSTISNQEKVIGETGKQYNVIRQSDTSTSIPMEDVNRVMTDKGLTIKKGEIIEKSPLDTNLSKADLNAVNEAYGLLKGKTSLTGNQYLNFRNKLDDLVNWKTDVTPKGEAIVKQMRGTIDAVAKKQITGLDTLDSTYGKEIQALRKVKKDYFNKDGSLKDNAFSKMANLTNKGRDELLNRVEKLSPGLGDKIRAVKVLEDVKSASGQKVGAYGKNIIGPVLGGMTGGVAGGIAGFLATNPKVVIGLIKNYANLRNWAFGEISSLIKNIEEGKPLTPKEMSMAKEAVTQSKSDSMPATTTDTSITSNANKNINIDNTVAPTNAKVKPPAFSKGENPSTSLVNEAKKYKSAEEFVKAQEDKTTSAGEYVGSHQAPTRDGYNAPGHDLTGEGNIYPSDIYTSPKASYLYGERGTPEYTAMSKKSLDIAKQLKDNPNKEVSVYRAAPKNIKDIKPGDWITLNRDYAKMHGESNLKGDYSILEKKVKADEIFTDGNSINEFGYDPRPLDKSQLTDIWNKAHSKSN